jgi:hypothetical protein
VLALFYRWKEWKAPNQIASLFQRLIRRGILNESIALFNQGIFAATLLGGSR